jgi:hypothetical protein
MIMPWRQIEKPKSVKPNQKLSEEYAGRGSTGLLLFERPFNRRRMSAYKKAMKEDRFRGTIWAKCFCKEDGHWWRVNGQTTSVSALELFEEGGFVPNFYISLEVYEADTLKEVRELWNTFDTRDSAKDTSDINNSFAKLDPRLAGVPKGLINTLVAGMSLSQWDPYYSNKSSAADRAELLLTNDNFCHWAVDMIQNGSSKTRKRKIEKAAAVAAMLDTWRKFPDEATKFWEGVRDANGINPEGGDRVLSDFLLQQRNRRNFYEDLWTDYGKCLKAWNAWRENRPVKELVFRVNDKLPEIK